MSPRLAGALTASLLILAGCAADDSAANDSSGVGPAPRLVLSAPSGVSGLAVVGGVLEVAEDGCVTIGAAPAILPAGTTVAEDNDALVTGEGRTVALGTEVDGAGGYPVAEENDEIVNAGCAEPGDEVVALGTWDADAEFGRPGNDPGAS